MIHNPKVGGSIPPPATISSIDSKTYVDNSLLPGLVDLNDESFIHSAHGWKLSMQYQRRLWRRESSVAQCRGRRAQQ